MDEEPQIDLNEPPPPIEVYEAVEAGNLDEVKEAIAQGRDINFPNPCTLDTPVIVAVKTRNKKMLELLLSYRQTDLNAQNEAGDTALHWAAFYGDVDVIQLLLANEALKDPIGEYGNTPLHLACSANRLEAVSVLLQTRRVHLLKFKMILGTMLLRCHKIHTYVTWMQEGTVNASDQMSRRKQKVKTVMRGDDGIEILREEELKRKATQKEAELKQQAHQQALELERKEQEARDKARKDAILAEERRIEEEDAAREAAELEEFKRQEEARREAERLEAERLKQEKKQKKYEKWLAKKRKKDPNFVDPKVRKAEEKARKAEEKARKAAEKAKKQEAAAKAKAKKEEEKAKKAAAKAKDEEAKAAAKAKAKK